MYFFFDIKRQGVLKLSEFSFKWWISLSKIKNLSKDTCRSLISRGSIGWKVKLTIRLWLNDHVIWVQPNKVNENEMDCGLNEIKWNMINEVWTEGNEVKHDEVNNVTMQLFLEKNWLEKQKRLYIFLKKANSKGRYTPHYLMIQPKSTHVQKHFCFDVDSKLFNINCNISVGKAMEERRLLQVATCSLLPR